MNNSEQQPNAIRQPDLYKENVSRSPSEQLIEICKNKRVAFLENGHFLDDLAEIVGEYLSKNGVDFLSICDVEKQGLEAVLRQ